MLSYVDSNSIKTNLTDDGRLQIGFKVDTMVNCNVRVSVCVTEEKNSMNVPIMFSTPNKTDYMQVVNMIDGMNQEILFGEINFNYSRMVKQELFSSTKKYFPMVISINYSVNDQKFAFINYCVFTKNAQNVINGARSIK